MKKTSSEEYSNKSISFNEGIKLFESLKEFNDDGGKWQLARPSDGTWTSLWKRELCIQKATIGVIEGGYTSTTPDSHTLVINVTVMPMDLQNGAEDQANETITVYYRDFRTEEEARKEMKKIMNFAISEEDPGVPPESSPLSIQLATQRSGSTIAI